jgi:hypothetical protein
MGMQLQRSAALLLLCNASTEQQGSSRGRALVGNAAKLLQHQVHEGGAKRMLFSQACK